MQVGLKSDNVFRCDLLSVCDQIPCRFRQGTISVFYFSLSSL